MVLYLLMKGWRKNMISSNNHKVFEPDDFEPEEVPQAQDDFQADDFVPDERKYEDLSWLEKHFSSEGQQLSAKKNRNLGKGVLSGLSAGWSEAIPGLKTEEGAESTGGQVAGAALPLGWLAKGITWPLKAAASLSPKFVKPLGYFANLLGISAAGGLYEGLEESAEKSIEAGEFIPPSPETIVEQGAKWAALDTALNALGLGARFAKALYNKSAELKIPASQLLEDLTGSIGKTDKLAQEALAKLEDKTISQIEKEAANVQKTEDFSTLALDRRLAEQAKDIRNKKIKAEDLTKLESSSTPKPYLPGEFQAVEIAENVINEDLVNRIESISQRAPSEKQLGENIKQDVERIIESNKKETDSLYEIAKKGEEGKFPKLQKTADAIVEAINKIESGGLNLTPEGYNKANKQLRDTLTDLGYGIETDANGKIIRAVEGSRQPLSKVIEVKKRLNNIINYDLLETSAGDFLKKPAYELRGDIRKGFGSKNSKARKAFEEAESKFGEFAEKKGKKSIQSIRTSQKPESISKTIKTPSGLADVKEVVSKEQFAQIEREILEHMQTMEEQKAASFYREMRDSLSPDSRAIAEEIIQSKAPKNSPSRKVNQREAIQKKAIDDIAKSSITGERPEVALDLWKTKEGQQLIKHALENNPNKAEVLKYLEEQSFKDFTSSIVTPDGKIEFKKLEKLLKDPATEENIRLIAGQEGVNFLKNLENLSNKIKKNSSIIEGRIDKGSLSERKAINKELEKRGQDKLNKLKAKNENVEKSSILYKFDDFLNSYGIKAKGLLAGLGILKYGSVKGISASIAYEVFSRIARNKKVQEAFKKAALSNSNPAALIKSLSELMDELDN
jgi:hypothetical protein